MSKQRCMQTLRESLKNVLANNGPPCVSLVVFACVWHLADSQRLKTKDQRYIKKKHLEVVNLNHAELFPILRKHWVFLLQRHIK